LLNKQPRSPGSARPATDRDIRLSPGEKKTLGRRLRAASSSLDLHTVLAHAADAAMELSGGDWVEILLRDAESGTMVGQYWTGRDYAWRARADKALRVEPGQGGAGLVLATGRPFRTDNYNEDPRLSSEYREVVREEHVVALVAVPIGAGGEIDGVLCVGNRSPRPFTERDEAVLGRLGRSVAPAVRNALAHSQSERRRRAAESLVAMGRALSHSLNVEQAAGEICESARDLFDARAAMLARLLPGEQRLEVVATAGDPGPALRAGVSIAPEMGIPWVAAREKRSVFTPDVLRDPHVTLTPELAACIGESADRAMVCVPLHAQGSVSGVLCVRDRAGRVFDEHELRLAEAFAAQAAAVLENATLYADMAVRRSESE
ncbi:MAG: GAF domain-containing protein, partial [candidate division NC10 bacterium]